MSEVTPPNCDLNLLDSLWEKGFALSFDLGRYRYSELQWVRSNGFVIITKLERSKLLVGE